MNRPIKLRAWDTGYGKFIYSDNRDLETQLFRLHSFFKEVGMLGSYDVYLQQSTGLFDKEGREIYEGDICKYSPDYLESQGGQITPTIKEVKFYDSGYFGWDGDLLGEFYEKDNKLYLKIIGNVFENPDLIK